MYNVDPGCIHQGQECYDLWTNCYAIIKFGEQTMANDFIGKMNTQLCLYNTMSFKTALEYIHIHVACYCL